MGEVAVSIKIMPEQDADINSIKNAVKELGAENVEEKPLGFGLKMLEAIFVFDDRQGANTDGIEEKIRHIKGISSVEAGDAALI